MSEDFERQNNPEFKPNSSSEVAKEQQEKLANKNETGIESPRDADMTAERARVEALETAISVEAGGKEKAKIGEPQTSKRRGPISKKQKEASFKRQMKEIQATEPPVSRAFSKIIHNRVVEKTSDVIGSTVARPNSILAGSIAAFLLTLVVYITAKIIGYPLSGFETIAAFAIGWVVGTIYDYLRVVITGKK
jgi:hypothetical protein